MWSFRKTRGQAPGAARHSQTRRRRLVLEDLEGRQLLSTFTVSNTSDSGAGSLRQAILSSNATTGGANIINFQIGSGGAQTITLASPLPHVSHAVAINGASQPNTGSVPSITLNGANAGTNAIGLELTASNSTISGLAIDSFSGDGVEVLSASGTSITGNYIGITPAGVSAGNGGSGVSLLGGSSQNTIGGTTAGTGNVLSGDGTEGIHIGGASTDNLVEGDRIGVNAAGNAAFANTDSGVLIDGTSSHNTIGGTAVGACNVISGNGDRGIHISGASNNLVQGNLIGVNAAGNAAIANADSGVLIDSNATNNVIGGTAVGACNVISGNGDRGVHISGASNNLVQGNLIGLNAAGNAAIGNGDSGVLIDSNATNNTIGGTTLGAGNVLSGNGLRGVHIAGASNNLVEGNLIGLNAAGTGVLGNSDSGVLIDGSSTGNTIGGTTFAARNVISGNGFQGVHITNGASDNLVEGNAMGVNAAGTAPRGNTLDGVLIDAGASYNTIGGTAAGAGNTISNNADAGVALNGAGKGNQIVADTINSNGYGQPTAGMGDGVSIVSSANTSVIDCVIDSNRDWGILAQGSASLLLSGNTTVNNGLGGVFTS